MPGPRERGFVARKRCVSALAIVGVALGLSGVLAALGHGVGRRVLRAPTTLVAFAPPRAHASSAQLSFNRDIRPILSNHCFQCHGPDAATREAGLRLDIREDAIAQQRSGLMAIVPGDPDASAILDRVTHADEWKVMPPPEIGKPLSETQISTLRAWIEAGAEYEPHWSFVPPVRAPLPLIHPPIGFEDWAKSPVDRWVYVGLGSEGLSPSPRASLEALVRRVTFDLTGLPPGPEEIDAFLSDGSPDAYERVVDRLLDSDAYAEHMARRWLDAARYGDTHGLHLDNAREMWPWRDWVINAFDTNMPFDRFTVDQLAGDLYDDPTLDQRIATGFNRNHVSTNEGGVIDAEVQMNNIVDRVATTGTVWLGLTLDCARCHDHKFDPVTQAEFFEIYAYFNNTTEAPRDGNRAAWAPFVRVPGDDQKAELASMDARIAEIRHALEAPSPETDAAEKAWRDAAAEGWNLGWSVPTVVEADSTGGSTLEIQDDRSVLATGENPDKDVYEITLTTDKTDLSLIRLESLVHDSLPHTGPGRAENANFVLSEFEVEARPAGTDAAFAPIEIVAAAADHEQLNGPFLVSQAIDGVVDTTNGWAISGFDRRENRLAVFATGEPFGFEGGTEIRVRLRFETHFVRHAAGRVRLAVSGDQDLRETLMPVVWGPWSAAGPFGATTRNDAFNTVWGPETDPGAFDGGATFEGDLAWTPRPGDVDGEVQTLEGGVSATYLTRSVFASSARTLQLSLGSDDAIKVWVNGALVHENDVARAVAPDQDQVEVTLEPGENRLLLKIVNFGGGYGYFFNADERGAKDYLEVLPSVLAEAPTDAQKLRVRRYFRETRSPEMRALAAELDQTVADRAALESMFPLTLVMEEREERRPTYRLERGEYDKPAEMVSPAVPSWLPPLPEGAPNNRLGFARWLVDPAHPLTARVTVNRFWQQFFGVGLVKTSEDFGSQAEWPSHPELLDWLALEFVESGWDVKHILRTIVTSETYKQSAAVTPELRALDPENRLLARGPRFRLEAEEIRDQALKAGGLLVETVGGPSVKPYQPDGLWQDVAYPDSDTTVWVTDEDDGRFRRSMYTYWKRTSPPPNLAAFDAPTREACMVRRSRTNTPMQALVLLNDPQFVEAARHLAQRVLLEEPDDARARLALAFRLVTSRAPEPSELQTLTDLAADLVAEYAADPDAALRLLAIGGSPRDASLDPAHHAALTNVAGAILSLDEAQTR